jgi:hypothetical protein
MIKSSRDSDNGEEVVLEKRNIMTLDNVRKKILIASSLPNHITEIDHFMERNLNSKRGLEELMRPYGEMERDRSKMRQQSLILDFFSRQISNDIPATSIINFQLPTSQDAIA